MPIASSQRERRPRLQELTFYLQPITGSDGRTPAAFEALVRWPWPDGTVRGPLDFLGALLHGDRIEAFTRFSIIKLATLLAEHPAAPPLHLNLSPLQLSLPDTERLLHDLRPSIRSRLRVELTEQRIPDLEAYAAQVRRLAGMGVGILLDDIRPAELPERLPDRLPVLGVKLDRSVLDELLTHPDGPAARTSRLLARRGLTVTAEGIEDAGVLPHLRRLGITHFQGFGLARPQPDLLEALCDAPSLSQRERRMRDDG